MRELVQTAFEVLGLVAIAAAAAVGANDVAGAAAGLAAGGAALLGESMLLERIR